MLRPGDRCPVRARALPPFVRTTRAKRKSHIVNHLRGTAKQGMVVFGSQCPNPDSGVSCLDEMQRPIATGWPFVPHDRAAVRKAKAELQIPRFARDDKSVMELLGACANRL